MKLRITKLRDFLHSLATDHMVPAVGSLCVYGTGSWLPVSLWYRQLVPCVSTVPAVGSLCLYGTVSSVRPYNTGIWLLVSLWYRQLALWVSRASVVGSLCLCGAGSWLPMSLGHR